MKALVSLAVNGVTHELYIDVRRSLLEVLRSELGLTGTHRGCDSGDCGACSVLRNGLPVTACLVLAADCSGDEVLTVEGLAVGRALHPVQQALVERGAIQCGFCTPGVVMNLVALLRETPRPSELQVRQALAGNLCRCTGYVKIVEAAMSLPETGT